MRYDYDDAEGVLSSKTHELDKELVTTKYTYDVQQRLTAIEALNRTTTYPSDPVLMYHQYYYDHQVPYHNFGSGLPPQSGFNHNGNINGVLSTYDFSGTYGTAPSLFQQPLLYGYKYDPLNRLMLADGTVGDFVAGASNEQLNDSYLVGDEDYTYDKIGNITRLQRKLRSPEPLEMVKNEGWYYNYALGNNRLMSVSGMPGSVTRGYSYDPNGNLLTDTHRGIIGTEYGRAAYAYEIKDGTNKFLYLYSTDDQRMYKKVETPTGTTTEFYLQDVSGKTVAVRRKVDAAPAEWDYYVNGTEREARLKGLNHTGGIEPKEIEFYLYDHLGNTRVVYQPKVAGANLELVINYVADYFPYGKILREYVNTNSGDPEKFLTTQHERDQETGFDYRGARFYDSDIARFLSVDPWATKYPAWSTYNYVMGNPISLIDPTGKGAENIGIDKKGNVIFDDGKNDGNLFLVNDGVDKVNSLSELQANSTQLSRDNVWIGTDNQLIDYVKGQMGHVDNINPNMFIKRGGSGLNIGMGDRTKNGLAVIGLGIIDMGSKIGIKMGSEFKFAINHKPGSKMNAMVNPYDLRNLLAHEGRHMSQFMRIHHTIGSQTVTIDMSKNELMNYLEYDAVLFQKSHSTYQKTTDTGKRSIEWYGNKHYSTGEENKTKFLNILNDIAK